MESIFIAVRGKECLWLPETDSWASVDSISYPVSWTTGRPETQTRFSVSPFYFHLPEKLHTTFPVTQTERQRSDSKWFPSKACLRWWWGQCVNSDANCLTVDHLRSLIHHDSLPMTLLFCKLTALCTLLIMHSVTSWLVGRLAAVNGLVLDCIQPHSLCCHLKAYLH